MYVILAQSFVTRELLKKEMEKHSVKILIFLYKNGKYGITGKETSYS